MAKRRVGKIVGCILLVAVILGGSGYYLFTKKREAVASSLSSKARNVGYPKMLFPPIDQSVVGWWKLNDNAANTTVKDWSSSGNTGTSVQNTSVISTTGYTGVANTAMTFNGTTDYVSIPHNTGLNPSATTRSVWIKSNELITGSMERSFVRKQKQIETGDSIEWYQGTIQFWAGTGIAQYTMDLSAGTWYHIVGTWDGGTALKLYLNGVQVSTGTGGSQLSNTTPITISGYDSTGDNVPDTRKFNGSISDVRIYNRALSANEVKGLYMRGR